MLPEPPCAPHLPPTLLFFFLLLVRAPFPPFLLELKNRIGWALNCNFFLSLRTSCLSFSSNALLSSLKSQFQPKMLKFLHLLQLLLMTSFLPLLPQSLPLLAPFVAREIKPDRNGQFSLLFPIRAFFRQKASGLIPGQFPASEGPPASRTGSIYQMQASSGLSEGCFWGGDAGLEFPADARFGRFNLVIEPLFEDWVLDSDWSLAGFAQIDFCCVYDQNGFLGADGLQWGFEARSWGRLGQIF